MSDVSPDVRRARQPLPEACDVAVIGAGPGGLFAAATLAQAGKKVAVFEAHYLAGGCATMFSRGPRDARLRFDVGLHYVGDCGENGAIPSLLRGVGVEPPAFLPLDPDGFDELVFPDFRFRIPVGIDRYRDRLVEHFPQEKRAIDKYVRMLRAVSRAGAKLASRDGKMSLGVAASLALDLPDLARLRGATMTEVLDGPVGARDPKLRAVLLGQHGDYGLPPSKVAAYLHFGLAAHYFHGAYYPAGGGQVMSDQLVARIEALGGTVHLRRPVERILVENGRAAGVRVAGKAGDPAQDVRAPVVISNADLLRTLDTLVGPDHLQDTWRARRASFEMAAALQITFLAVKADLRALGMRNTNYWLSDGYDVDAAYRDVLGAGAHADASTPIVTHGAYITSATLKDPEHHAHHAPDGVHTVEVMSLVPGEYARWGVSEQAVHGYEYRDNAVYRARKAEVEEDMVRRFLGLFPVPASAITYRESATPVSHGRFTRASGGTGYGLAATPGQFMEHRPGARGPVPGLYLAGASTRSGHGIVGAMAGGRAAGRRVMADAQG